MGHNGELGDFLRSRRALLTPDTAGLPPGAGRAGRPSREEVAPLAGVTTDYTRLEQGRHPHLSEAVLASVPHALRLDDERGYLFALTRPASHRPVAPAHAPSGADPVRGPRPARGWSSPRFEAFPVTRCVLGGRGTACRTCPLSPRRHSPRRLPAGPVAPRRWRAAVVGT